LWFICENAIIDAPPGVNSRKLIAMETTPNPNKRKTDPSGRSPYAVGYEWSVRISSIALGMVLPAVFGIWLDAKCGTLILFTVLGAILGMTTALIQLIRIGKDV